MHWIDCRGLKKAAVTNAPKENARVMLAALGMDKWFDAIVLGEDCERPKPHPDPYLEGLKVLGIVKDEALICEDSPSGTRADPADTAANPALVSALSYSTTSYCAGTAAGIAAGIPVVGVLTSQTMERMHKAGVFVAVKDYHELLALVKKHVPYDEECDVKYK